MGYTVKQGESSFKIKGENLANVLTSIKYLASKNTRLGTAYGADLLKSTSIEDAFEELGWTLLFENDNVVNIEHNLEYLGCEKTLFSKIAPFVESGSFIEMMGEDGTQWRWCFEEGKMIERTPTVNW